MTTLKSNFLVPKLLSKMVLRKRQLEGQSDFKLSIFNQMIIYFLYEDGSFSITRKINSKENL